jgi:glycosyltransferase involved in cell wall biosynthesis
MPSLVANCPGTVRECLAGQVPFLASRVGGIPELIAEPDRNRVCFEPKADVLFERLLQALRQGHAPARLSFDPDLNGAECVRWHEQILRPVSPGQTPPDHSTDSARPADPTISVCITHYNRPRFLRQALRSILKQDRAPLEVIVVDDGSPGEDVQRELDAIERAFDFARRGWQLIRQENRYLGAARNRAAAAAHGDYLLFMDDDNLAKPQEIATFTTAARYSGADVLTCLVDTFEGAAAPAAADEPKHRWLYEGANPPLSVVFNTFGDANALCRRKAFLEVGGFTEDPGVTHEDWELFTKFMLQGYRSTVIPEALFWYREMPTSMIRSTSLRANFARSLRPHLPLISPLYHPLIEMALGQSLVQRGTLKPRDFTPNSEQHPQSEGPPLRYRLVDALNARVKRIRLVHGVARRLVRALLQTRSLLRSRQPRHALGQPSPPMKRSLRRGWRLHEPPHAPQTERAPAPAAPNSIKPSEKCSV